MSTSVQTLGQTVDRMKLYIEFLKYSQDQKEHKFFELREKTPATWNFRFKNHSYEAFGVFEQVFQDACEKLEKQNPFFCEDELNYKLVKDFE